MREGLYTFSQVRSILASCTNDDCTHIQIVASGHQQLSSFSRCRTTTINGTETKRPINKFEKSAVMSCVAIAQ
ncbi:hypothetical protein CY34DRAFT_749640 [Suillus luteus UH-Slu-Lm8-n1]|uniref:Uncharacterized protein n=1 Tax=Suillus luteus UH-Slu-Lm8-n1 TaxID=930992 RepID=A0A0D0BI97_9AGAM|nr:hypothetical protein CY34DRAFT_749640 [Suillus luteus UH-Slu-Lm8-n1]